MSSSRSVVLGTACQEPDIDAFITRVRTLPNFIDIEEHQLETYASFIEDPEWLCSVSGIVPAEYSVHQMLVTPTEHNVPELLEMCDTMFRQERFNIFGLCDTTPEVLNTCLETLDDLTLDISTVQQPYWFDRRAVVEQHLMPVIRDRCIRFEAYVSPEWTEDRTLGLTWLTRHSALQILPYISAKDAVIMNSHQMEKDLLSSLYGRPLTHTELETLEKNNDCVYVYDEDEKPPILTSHE